MPTPEDIKRRIEAGIPGAQATVEDFTGGGDHFRATVAAATFAGRSRIEQHRLVYDIFDGEIGGPIHALSLKTEVGDAAEPVEVAEPVEAAAPSAEAARQDQAGT
jgi:stress-induced morphogen